MAERSEKLFSLGTPVIGSRIGAMAELIVDGKSGLLFEPGDADDLDRKLSLFIRDETLQATLGAGARQRFEARYTREKSYEQLMDIYRAAGAVESISPKTKATAPKPARRKMTILRYLPRFREAEKQMGVLANRESWSRTAIDSFQLEKLNNVWSHAIKHVTYYRQLQKSLDLPKSFGDLQEYFDSVPILDKTLVRNSPQQFLSDHAEAGDGIAQGDPRGVPMGVYWGKTAHREMLRAKYRFEQKFGLDVFDRKVFVWGHSGSFAPGVRGIKQRFTRPFSDKLRNRLRLSAYRLGQEEVTEHLQAIQKFAPTSIYGYSSAVYLLAREAERQKLELPSLKLAIMTAEPADDPMRAATSFGLNAPAVMEYGSVECGSMAFHDPDDTLRIREDVCLLETLPRDDGQYDIVVSVLNNPSYPLLRYRIEDFTDQPKAVNDVGFSSLNRVAGRNNDFLQSRGGRRLHSMAIKHLFEHDEVIRRFQAIQRSDGSLDVHIEANKEYARTCEPIREKMEQLLEGFPVRLEAVSNIDGNTAGKHRWIVSEMEQT